MLNYLSLDRTQNDQVIRLFATKETLAAAQSDRNCPMVR